MASVDLALFELLTDGDREFAEELFEMWEGKVQGDLTSLQVALDAEDADTLLHVAHSLKGASANLGAVDVQAASKTLEFMGRAGDLSKGEQALESLRGEIAAAMSVYKDYFAALAE
jgi:HPt (histidine-containing phosphotransfer) domain-containing protein